jgi:hypothetical protein
VLSERYSRRLSRSAISEFIFIRWRASAARPIRPALATGRPFLFSDIRGAGARWCSGDRAASQGVDADITRLERAPLPPALAVFIAAKIPRTESDHFDRSEVGIGLAYRPIGPIEGPMSGRSRRAAIARDLTVTNPDICTARRRPYGLELRSEATVRVVRGHRARTRLVCFMPRPAILCSNQAGPAIAQYSTQSISPRPATAISSPISALVSIPI